MLPTIIAALSALMLLCVPTSNLQSCGLYSVGRTPLMTNLLRVGPPAVTGQRPEAQPAQAPASERGVAQSAEESQLLEPGKPIERELSGGRSHFYKTNLTSGQYLQISVSQLGIDALVAIYAPDGKKIDEEDRRHTTEWSETISAIAEEAGAYMVEVRSAEKTAQT